MRVDDYDPADLAALAEPLVLLDSPEKSLIAGNRIVYQPMEANDGEEDGSPSPATILRYRDRAGGFAGIDFVEALTVAAAGRARPRQLILEESTRRGIEKLVGEYRKINPETPLLFQLTHSGRFALDPVTPYPLKAGKARLLRDEDMLLLRDRFVAATRIAYECGADGIDFKHCHGYLCGSLLGPANGKRPGWSFGGESLEERTRFLTGTLARMMDAVPPDRFLYTVRLSAFEGIPGGFGSRGPTSTEEDPTYAELTELVRILERAGVALINQSSGVPELTPLLVRQTNENPQGFLDHQRRAEAIKRAVQIPVVGSGYSYVGEGKNRLPGAAARDRNIVTLGGRAVREGKIDFIGIGRQSLADPGFARLLLSGGADQIQWDTACNRCATALRSGIPAGCVAYDPEARRRYQEMRRRRRS